MNFFGIPIIESRYAVSREKRQVHGVYADWRERLNRNFGRPSTAKWEPIEGDWETTVDVPAVFMVDGNRFIAHPELVATLLLQSTAVRT